MHGEKADLRPLWSWGGWIFDWNYGKGVLIEILADGRVTCKFDAGDIVVYHHQPDTLSGRTIIRDLSNLKEAVAQRPTDVWEQIVKHISSRIHLCSGVAVAETAGDVEVAVIIHVLKHCR